MTESEEMNRVLQDVLDYLQSAHWKGADPKPIRDSAYVYLNLSWHNPRMMPALINRFAHFFDLARCIEPPPENPSVRIVTPVRSYLNQVETDRHRQYSVEVLKMLTEAQRLDREPPKPKPEKANVRRRYDRDVYLKSVGRLGDETRTYRDWSHLDPITVLEKKLHSASCMLSQAKKKKCLENIDKYKQQTIYLRNEIDRLRKEARSTGQPPIGRGQEEGEDTTST